MAYMRCTACKHKATKVLETRNRIKNGMPVNVRRRVCLSCGHRFSTVEITGKFALVSVS